MSNLNTKADTGPIFPGNIQNSAKNILLPKEGNNNDITNLLCKKMSKDQIYDLKENMLHVWCISLDELQQFLPVLRRNLSEDELSRSEMYHFQKDKNSFILRRSILRILISNYLEIDVRQIQFCCGKWGKPGIASNYCNKPFNFNLSHSKNLLLYAFARKREVGIDIEHVRPIPEAAQIVESNFSNKEKKVFSELSEDLRKESFFRLWTRKEAFLKATGKGLDQSLDSVDATSSDGFLQIQKNEEISSNWHIEDLFPAPGFSAAYAIEGTAPLKCVFQRGTACE